MEHSRYSINDGKIDLNKGYSDLSQIKFYPNEAKLQLSQSEDEAWEQAPPCSHFCFPTPREQFALGTWELLWGPKATLRRSLAYSISGQALESFTC
jgi:hypothetical protein